MVSSPCRLSSLLALVCAGTLGSASAVAAAPTRSEAEPSRAANALVTGFAIAGGSLAIGGYVLATEDSLTAKHNGLYLMHGGLTLAPLAAHGVTGEWWRGAFFSVPPALAGIGMAALLEARPEAPIVGRKKSQRIYPVLIAVGVIGSAVGIFDAAMVDERHGAGLQVTAAAGPDFSGAVAYGSF